MKKCLCFFEFELVIVSPLNKIMDNTNNRSRFSATSGQTSRSVLIAQNISSLYANTNKKSYMDRLRREPQYQQEFSKRLDEVSVSHNTSFV